MSTRSNIGIVVRDIDKGKTFTPQLSLLHQELYSDLKMPVLHDTHINTNTEIIQIYHHTDGYPEGLGELLLEHYNSYEKALNITLFGDCSSLFDTRFYNTWREGEDWNGTKPQQKLLGKISKVSNDYYYLFDNGEWYFASYGENPNFVKLADYLESLKK